MSTIDQITYRARGSGEEIIIVQTATSIRDQQQADPGSGGWTYGCGRAIPRAAPTWTSGRRRRLSAGWQLPGRAWAGSTRWCS